MNQQARRFWVEDQVEDQDQDQVKGEDQDHVQVQLQDQVALARAARVLGVG